jgi:acyl carrier protein
VNNYSAEHARETSPDPSSDTRSLIRSALKEVLPGSSVDFRRHFVDLGGDSLAAVKLMARLSGTVKIALSPLMPFEADTLEDLVARIEIIRLSRNS